MAMDKQNSKISVLFVCLGNICRSPMAEAVFRNMVEERKLEFKFHIDSCGTANYHVGMSPDPRTIATCKKHGIKVVHTGRQVRLKDFDRFDYVLCMDDRNLEILSSYRPPNSKAIVKMFGEFDPEGELLIQGASFSSERIHDMVDPYHGGIEGFEHNFQQCVRCSAKFLDHLQTEVAKI